MSQVKYTKDHEYIVVEDGIGTVGITNHAQEKLGDITFVEMPPVGAAMKRGDSAGVVESVKAASDVYTPVSGAVVEVNAALEDKPEIVNEDAEGAGWFFKIKLSDPTDLSALMDKDAYLAYAREQG
ncbi:MAG: glycine cleavage system protein GcvH [Rhodomicrobium sp.]